MNAVPDVEFSWDLLKLLAEEICWAEWAVRNTTQLLDDDNTIPFIARYRKQQTNNMDADKLRQLLLKYEELKSVQAKVLSVAKSIHKQGKLVPSLKTSLCAAQTLEEVEHLYAPFKPGSKRSLAERAREAGLEPLTQIVLNKPWNADIARAVNPQKEGLKTLQAVETGVGHIISDIVAKDKDVMDMIRNICKRAYITLESTQSTKSKTKKKEDEEKPQNRNKTNPDKFELYFNFTCSVKTIKPHQVMAINRGESLKVLTVKIHIPPNVKQDFLNFCNRRFVKTNANQSLQKLIIKAIEDSYDRLVQPVFMRHYRSQLTKNAEMESVAVFASNLKRLLMTPPFKGKSILGVDPGFRNGCKFALISPTGKVLDTGVAYLHTGNNKHEQYKIADVLLKHRCEIVAIGNGTACRETETFFSRTIKTGVYAPLNVSFCIVSESGASIYSASEEAIKEFPEMDVSLRGGVSIARRLQDPLAELVKIEPKHIGVGMYQHDIADKLLKSALDGVVEDCVSFVGVDINTCSESLLRHVAGMTAALAKKVLAMRDEKGAFMNREQLNQVKGLGPKSFKQCAGFIRIMSDTACTSKVETTDTLPPAESGRKRKAASTSAKSKKAKIAAVLTPNPLDMTAIHPESYDVAEKLLSDAGISKGEIGQPQAIQQLSSYISSKSLEDVQNTVGCDLETLKLIRDALKQPLGYDLREEFEKPLFKQGVQTIESLKSGNALTGRVSNCTHFGAFVDVGVGNDGLIHTSQMDRRLLNGKRFLELGDKVEVDVTSVDVGRRRIQLRLKKLL